MHINYQLLEQKKKTIRYYIILIIYIEYLPNQDIYVNYIICGRYEFVLGT